jgi:hypothetical protein
MPVSITLLVAFLADAFANLSTRYLIANGTDDVTSASPLALAALRTHTPMKWPALVAVGVHE